MKLTNGKTIGENVSINHSTLKVYATMNIYRTFYVFYIYIDKTAYYKKKNIFNFFFYCGDIRDITVNVNRIKYIFLYNFHLL